MVGAGAICAVAWLIGTVIRHNVIVVEQRHAAGIVITVQGFETVRYLGDEYDGPTRGWASRLAQLISASIYIGFVAVATPAMGLGPRPARITLCSMSPGASHRGSPCPWCCPRCSAS